MLPAPLPASHRRSQKAAIATIHRMRPSAFVGAVAESGTHRMPPRLPASFAATITENGTAVEPPPALTAVQHHGIHVGHRRADTAATFSSSVIDTLPASGFLQNAFCGWRIRFWKTALPAFRRASRPSIVAVVRDLRPQHTCRLDDRRVVPCGSHGCSDAVTSSAHSPRRIRERSATPAECRDLRFGQLR